MLNYKFMAMQCEAKASLIIAVVFDLAELYDDAILQSGKTLLSRGPRWSSVDIGRLCCTKKFDIMTSALITLECKTLYWRKRQSSLLLP